MTTGLGDAVRRRRVGAGDEEGAVGLGLSALVGDGLVSGEGATRDDGELPLGSGAGFAVVRAVGDGDDDVAPAGGASSNPGPRARAATHASSETRMATTRRL